MTDQWDDPGEDRKDRKVALLLALVVVVLVLAIVFSGGSSSPLVRAALRLLKLF